VGIRREPATSLTRRILVVSKRIAIPTAGT
jgi:hypothetical protein